MGRFTSVLVAVLSSLSLVIGAPRAHAGPAVTATSYFDGFPDLIGIDPFQSVDIELDALGGVRMKGNGASEPTVWTSQTDFEGSTVYKPAYFIDNPLILMGTLDAGTLSGSLVLPTTPYAFRRVSPEPVLLPAPAFTVDGYGVAGMCVRRVDGPLGRYYMWYTGTPENEHTSRIYLATSGDGVNWTRRPQYDPVDPSIEIPVLDIGAPGSFDSRQLGRPSVLYDDTAPEYKFKMWYSAEGDLYGSIGYAISKDGVVWEKWVQPVVTLDGADGDVGQNPALAVGADGLPVIAYYDVTNGDLKFVHCGNAFCSDGNSIVTLDQDGDVGRFASLGIAGDGLPVVSYYDAINGALKVVHCGTAACMVGNTVTTLDGAAPGSDVGQYTSLAMDGNGYPLIAYYDVTNGDLKFVGCTDYACAGGDELPAAVDGAAANVGQYASLALVAPDPLDPATLAPAIAYYDVTNTDLKLVVCNDALCAGADEAPVTLDLTADDVGKFASLAVSPAGFPAVAYYDATNGNGNLKFVACNDALCAGADDLPIALDDDAASDRGAYASLLFGADGLPVIGYYDATNGDLVMVSCNDALCADGDEEPVVVGNAGTIDVATLVGRQLALAPVGGAPHLVYYDATNGDLMFTAGQRDPMPVLGPGIIGSIDSFTVAHPSVILDNGVYRMWYTADDSNNKRIAYASSTDGVTWARGGLVLDVGTGNYALGAWGPSVLKLADDSYAMTLTTWNDAGTKIQAKLYYTTSKANSNGTEWNQGNVAKNPSNSTDVDGDSLSQGSMIHDPLDTTYPYKIWYVGASTDPVTKTSHDRIGFLADNNLNGQFESIAGPEPDKAVLGLLNRQGPAFDSMSAYDLRVVPDPLDGAKLLGFFVGRNAADFKDRIGVVESADDGVTWSDRFASHVPLIGAGGAGTASERGVLSPAPLYLDATNGWLIYHTSHDADLQPTVALDSAAADLSSVAAEGAVTFAAGGTCADTGGRTDPFVIVDGTSVRLYYVGLDSTGLASLCTALWTSGARTAFGATEPILQPDDDPADGVPDDTPYNDGGLRRPVIWRDAGGQWQLWYTANGTDGVERIAHAASTDGLTWTKTGLAVIPSTAPYDFAEKGVWPGSAWTNAAGGVSLAFTGVDRFGWRRTGLLAAAGAGYVENASATYQFPDDAALGSATPLDWRSISWNPLEAPTGSGLEVWVAYYPTYSGKWSNFFKIDNAVDLPFLLDVNGMRWQVRAAGDPVDVAVTPQLDDLTADKAPIAFPSTAAAATLPIAPAAGWYLTDWGVLTVKRSSDAGGTLAVRIADQEGTTIVPDIAITGSELVYPLTGNPTGNVPKTSGPLTLFFTFTPAAGTPPESPLLQSINVTFTSTDVPSSLTLTAEPNPLPYNAATATLSGWLTSDGTGLVGQTVTLSKRLVTDTAYTVIGEVTTAEGGAFQLAGLTQADDTIYKAEWIGGDVGGTVYPPAMSTFTLQMAPATLTFRSAANPILHGKSTTLTGTLISSTTAGDVPVAGETITINYRLPSATTYTLLGTATTDATGTFTYATPVAPRQNTVYQAVFRSKASVEFTLGVKPVVGLRVAGYAGRMAKWHRYPFGTAVTMVGNVVPNHRLLGDGITAGRVLIQVERLSGTWKVYRRIGKALTATSAYRHIWKPTLKGSYRIRTTFAADTDHAAGGSPYRYVQVY